MVFRCKDRHLIMLRLFFSGVLLVVSLCFVALANEEVNSEPNENTNVNIMLIHGFNPMLPWSQEFIKGVANGAKKADQKVNVFVESIYSEFSDTGIDFDSFVASLSIKYKDIQIDAIVGDNVTSSQFVEHLQASDFFQDAELTIFDAMKVYSPQSPSIVSPYQFFNADNIKKQVENIFFMVPSPKRIIVNSSKVNLFVHHYEAIKKYHAANFPDVPLEVWSMDNADVLEQAGLLTHEDIFIYFPVFKDFEGANIPPKLFLRAFAKHLEAPLFSFYSTFMGEGIVGGLVYDGRIQGESAIKFTLARLGFESMEQTFPTARWMYDQAQLDRFALHFIQDESEVTIVNPATSIIDEYPIQLAVMIMLFGTTLLGIFLYKNRKLNRAYEELEIAHSVVEKTADQAIEASNTKSKFLAIVSHEIRTPINGLMGVLEMLKHTKLEPKQTELLNMGVYSSESLLRTVNDILDFSKLNSKKFTLDTSGFSPRELMSEVVQYAEVIAGASGLEVKHDLSKLVDVPLLGDKSRIKQIFDNLINNAVKFTTYGSISVFARVSRSGQRYTFKCSIEDTGVGIDKAQQETLFKPFNQAQNHLQQSSKGTGLGLSICKELVQIMGGEIALESELGKGTKITVELPLTRATSVTKSKIQGLHFDINEIIDKKILLVEDNVINQEIAKMQLSLYGLNCDIANDGQDCLDKLKDEQSAYDIILMDIQMPRLDGYSATRMIRAQEAGARNKDIPIIALTAHVSLDEQQMAHSVGMNSHINKPVDSINLVSEIYRLLSTYNEAA